MKALPIAALAIGVLSAGGPALADSQPYQGTVQSVKAASDTVTLDDGTKFYATPGVEIDGLQPGTDVIFFYYVYDGRNTVVSYEILAP